MMASCTAENAATGFQSVHAILRRKGVMEMDKVVIVVKDGMVQRVFEPCPCKFEVEILNMDFSGADPDAEIATQNRL